ncbi:DUF819 family protein, partial [Acidobacteria bacterium AH-259-D05]|nr:DUF819 family protein [Acidobacteria bacterium AH-259-D05]
MAVFAFCAVTCGVVFWISSQSWAQGFFKIIPSVVLIYYVPTLASTFGFIPSNSAAYDWMRDYLLPFSLFILMITTDVSAVLRIGPRAIVMMLFGTVGVVIGGPLALLFFGHWLPPDTWKGLAALSGSWIGGGGNFAALKESVGAPDSIIGPIIIVDTAVAYTWMGVLLFLANYQGIIDRWNKAQAGVLEDLNRRLKVFQESQLRPAQLADVFIVLAIGFAGAVICQHLSNWIYQGTRQVLMEMAPGVASIFSPFTWLVILISTLGILLSFSPVRRIEAAGASKLGYAALYLFLTSIGAKADLSGILAAPILLLVGMVWMACHVLFLLIGARLLRVPFFLVAVGSQANIGGAASAPIVAAAYYESMAPVGLLMGVFGYLLGNYA